MILEIISSENIETQEQLLERLEARGISIMETTTATRQGGRMVSSQVGRKSSVAP